MSSTKPFVKPTSDKVLISEQAKGDCPILKAISENATDKEFKTAALGWLYDYKTCALKNHVKDQAIESFNLRPETD